MIRQQTLLDFSTAGPIAVATPATVVKVAMTRFLLLSYNRALRAPNNSTENQTEIYDQDAHHQETFVHNNIAKLHWPKIFGIHKQNNVIPVPVGWILLFASSNILFTASIDSKRTWHELTTWSRQSHTWVTQSKLFWNML